MGRRAARALGSKEGGEVTALLCLSPALLSEFQYGPSVGSGSCSWLQFLPFLSPYTFRTSFILPAQSYLLQPRGTTS